MENVNRVVAALAVPLMGWAGIECTLIVWQQNAFLAISTVFAFSAPVLNALGYAIRGRAFYEVEAP